jgi:hypothetical protein
LIGKGATGGACPYDNVVKLQLTLP